MKVGDADVGKTSIRERYTQNVFNEHSANDALTEDFRVKTIQVGSSTVKLKVGRVVGRPLTIFRFGTPRENPQVSGLCSFSNEQTLCFVKCYTHSFCDALFV